MATHETSVTVPDPQRAGQIARRRATLGLLVAAGCISYVDRAALSVSNTAVMADFGMSYAQAGLLLSAFAWAYLACQIPMGVLADRLGGRVFLGAGLVVWSLAQALFGLVHTQAGLFVCRAMLGLGEAPLFLAGTRVLVRWYPPGARASAIGLFNGSASLGPALAPPVLLAIMAWGGWRGMSVSIGLASLALAAVWVLYYRDPAPGTVAHDAERGPPAPSVAMLGMLLRRRATWMVSIGSAGVVYVTWLFGSWMPTWLQATQHVSARTAGLLSALPQICGFLGCVGGGALSDWLMRRGMSPLEACRRPVVVSMLAAGVLTGACALPPGLAVSVAVIGCALFAGGIAMSCGWTLGTIIAPEAGVATLEAIQNTGGSFGGALAPALTGLLARHFGGFGPAMLLAAAVGIACAAIYHVGLRGGDAGGGDAGGAGAEGASRATV